MNYSVLWAESEPAPLSYALTKREGSKRMMSLRTARCFRLLLLAFLIAVPLLSQQPHAGGEANLVLPDLDQATFFGGIGGRTLLMAGLVVCALGLAFGLGMYKHLRNLPVHASMLEISELIYETCKTYLITQGKFLLILELFIGVIIVFYFGFLQHFDAVKVSDNPAVQPYRHRRQLRRGLVRHSREYVREFADGVRQPYGQAVPVLRDSAKGRHQHRHAADLASSCC